MNLHLAEVARQVAPGAHAMLLMDQAGWHITAKLAVPGNISIASTRPNALNSTVGECLAIPA